MKRQGFELPLMIGGATTSKLHTALRIAPAYDGGVVHVNDASRAVGVVGHLRSDERRPGFLADTSATYKALCERRAKQGSRKLLSLADAQANRLVVDFVAEPPPQPSRPGVHVLEGVDVETLRPFIDWTPFFQTWELKGRYPAIFDHPAMGPTARELFGDAQAVLDNDAKRFGLAGVLGIFPANTVGDVIEIYSDTHRTEVRARLPTLRQRGRKSSTQPNLALADFVAPKASGISDWIGAFAVTAGLGLADQVAAYKAAGDDYNAILLEALADRLAEASAEYYHMRLRRVLWGYADTEAADHHALIAERYQGVRPAPGYPACPDHSQKQILFELLGATEVTGAKLTENFAIDPAASVAGWYFAHPKARYFGVGKTE
jgi:5-methyltetrahydrofolate--homocysteine methyltransferase